MNEVIESYLKSKCEFEKIKAKINLDIYKLLKNDFIRLFKEKDGAIDFLRGITAAENLISITISMIISGARVNRKGRTFDEIFCFTPIKNTRLIKI